MTPPTDDPTLRVDPRDELLAVEYDVPDIETDLEEQAELERDRSAEQIYAALVAPSF